MEENKILETDIVSPKEGKDITEEVVEEGFVNIFTKDKYNTEREAVDSYDALNSSFITIDDIRSDFGRLSNPSQIAILQEELRKILPDAEIDVNGIFGRNTEKALKMYDLLVRNM